MTADRKTKERQRKREQKWKMKASRRHKTHQTIIQLVWNSRNYHRNHFPCPLAFSLPPSCLPPILLPILLPPTEVLSSPRISGRRISSVIVKHFGMKERERERTWNLNQLPRKQMKERTEKKAERLKWNNNLIRIRLERILKQSLKGGGKGEEKNENHSPKEPVPSTENHRQNDGRCRCHRRHRRRRCRHRGPGRNPSANEKRSDGSVVAVVAPSASPRHHSGAPP